MWARSAPRPDHVRRARGRVWRGVARPDPQPDRDRFRRWLTEEVARKANGAPVAIAVEGCTGWRYVVEEICAAGFEAHVAEPAETQAARGRKNRAKTDRSDSRLQRELLVKGELPESWIPPYGVLEWRERTRLYKTLVDERRMWGQRIHAELFQHGVTCPERHPCRADPCLAGRRQRAAQPGRSPAHRRWLPDNRRPRGGDRPASPPAASLRCTPARVSGARRQPLRDRPVERADRVGRARRLPVIQPIDAGRAPHRSRHHRPRVQPLPSGRLLVPARPGHPALGAVRGRQVCGPGQQPRVHLLPGGQAPSRRQARRHRGGPQARPRCYHTLRTMDPEVVYAMPEV